MFIVAPFVIWLIIIKELKGKLYSFERDIILFSWIIITFISYVSFMDVIANLISYDNLNYMLVFWTALIGALCGFFITLIAVFCFKKVIKKKISYDKTIGNLMNSDKTIK